MMRISHIAIVTLFATSSMLGCDGVADRNLHSLGVGPISMAEEPYISIGGNDSGVTHQIASVYAAIGLSNGGVVIADDRNNLLQFYDGFGEYVGSAGGTGSGLGKFERIGHLGRLNGDTVVAWDLVQRTLSMFNSAGELLGTDRRASIDAIIASIRESYATSIVGTVDIRPMPNGNMLVAPLMLRQLSSIGIGAELIQDTVPLVLLDSSGEQWHTIAHLPDKEFFFYKHQGRLRPFHEQVRAVSSGNAIFIGSTRDSTIFVYSGDSGQLEGKIQLPISSRRPSRGDLRIERRRFASTESDAYMKALSWPSTLPVFSGMLAAADGRLWIQRTSGPSERVGQWLIFNPDAQLEAYLLLDSQLRLMDAGADFVVLLERNELGLDNVRIHKIVWP